MALWRLARRAFVGSLVSVGLTPGLAQGQQTPTPDAEDPLRYLDAAYRLSVRAYVNGLGPFDFLVDTGATTSVISTELADQMGLRRSETGRLHSIAGAETVSMARVATLAVGKRVRRDVTVAVLPRALLRMDGLLGLEWLGPASLLLDFTRRRMTVGEALPIPDDQTVTVKSRLLRSGLTLIDAYIPSQHLIAFIDTGSTTTAGNLALEEAARRGGSLAGASGATALRSVTGQTLQGRTASLTRLSLGKLTLRNVPLVMGPIHTFEFWGLQNQPAIVIGTDVLRAFDSVAIDMRRSEVRFRVPG